MKRQLAAECDPIAKCAKFELILALPTAVFRTLSSPYAQQMTLSTVGSKR